MIVKLLTEHHLEFLSLKRGCAGSSESTHFKMPHCWKSSITAHIVSKLINISFSKDHNFQYFVLNNVSETSSKRFVGSFDV